MGPKKLRWTNKKRRNQTPVKSEQDQQSSTLISLRSSGKKSSDEAKNSDDTAETEVAADTTNIDDDLLPDVPLEGTTDGVFVVDKILDKKIVDGKVWYYLRWLGYGPAWDTWEPEDNLGCVELKEKFEENLARERQEAERKRGFDRGLRAIEIIGLVTQPGYKRPSHFLVRWEGIDYVDPLPVAECNEKIPQLVIQFYSDRRVFDIGLGGSPPPSKEFDSEGPEVLERIMTRRTDSQ